MVLFWVDDTIFYAKDSSSINAIISDLKHEFLLEREEDMAGFLGLSISRNDIKAKANHVRKHVQNNFVCEKIG